LCEKGFWNVHLSDFASSFYFVYDNFIFFNNPEKQEKADTLCCDGYNNQLAYLEHFRVMLYNLFGNTVGIGCQRKDVFCRHYFCLFGNFIYRFNFCSYQNQFLLEACLAVCRTGSFLSGVIYQPVSSFFL